MIVRLSVSYPATDGSMPESVEIEWTGQNAEPITGLPVVLAQLLAAPSVVRPGGREIDALAREARQSADAEQAATEPHCRRTVCGHPKSLHTSGDEVGRFIGLHEGTCSVCGSADQCRSFVGSE